MDFKIWNWFIIVNTNSSAHFKFSVKILFLTFQINHAFRNVDKHLSYKKILCGTLIDGGRVYSVY